MAERDKNAAIADEIYSQSSYSWDGNSRPNINDYIDPWARYANLTESGATAWKKNRYYNSAIRYAKTMLESAISQYDNDVAFWNERDERSYTSPSAQSQRLEDAGYNLGYMYGSVDSGNSAVGYDQGDSSYTPNDTSSKSNERAKVVIEAVGTAFSIATNLIKSGISIKELPYKIAESSSRGGYYSSASILYMNRSEYQQFVNELRAYFQYHDKDGNPVDSLGDSLQAAFDAISYKLSDSELTSKSFFNQYAQRLYEYQSTPSGYQNIMSWINNSDLPDWAKGTFSVLTYIFDIVLGNTSQTKVIK